MADSFPSSVRKLGFDELAELHDYLEGILQNANRSLEPYHAESPGGFAHRVDPASGTKPPKWSKSSTATCIAFLSATGRLGDEPWGGERDDLVHAIVTSDWNSADLGENNPFTVAFLLEALADLGGAKGLSIDQRKTVRKKVQLLVDKFKEDGGIRLQDFESTAFLTYKAVSALSRWSGLDAVRDKVEPWNWNHLNKESLLVASGSVDADVFEVAYSVLIASAVAPLDRMSPQQRGLLRYAVGQFFDAQRPDGAWPRSRPLFVYPKLGHAYCFDYELLAALLSDRQLRPLVFERLGDLDKAAAALDERKYPLKGPGGEDSAPYGWSSGHHGSTRDAESWSTASALHFCFVLDRLVAEAIRQETFRYARARYSAPRLTPGDKPFLPNGFLDSDVRLSHAGRRSLKALLTKKFIQPLVEGRDELEQGRPLPEGTPCSAILYGPPGTSKTELAKHVARALGWPLLALDPSHLTRRGLDEVHAEASTLFGMLERCEQTVVLLDEFDELVREREGAGELESRFLTTAMLPKLAALSRERRIVYLVATNHLERFDAAIRRPGRFHVIVPVMPPRPSEKLRKWPKFKEALATISEDDIHAGSRAKGELGDLTFLEAQDLADRLDDLNDPTDPKALIAAFADAAKRCTLRQSFAPEKAGTADNKRDWKAQIRGQEHRIRGLGFY